jgi:hypothetical protein
VIPKDKKNKKDQMAESDGHKHATKVIDEEKEIIDFNEMNELINDIEN